MNSFFELLVNISIKSCDNLYLFILDTNHPYIFRHKSWDELSSKEQNQFLQETLGSPRKYGKKKVLIPTIFYSTVSVLGIPGNILTCLTIYKNSYMKTASNFFIFNLAIADLVTLILGKILFLQCVLSKLDISYSYKY